MNNRLTEQESAESAAWLDLSKAVKTLSSAIDDRDSAGDVPKPVEDEVTTSIQQVIERPAVALLEPSDLERRLNQGMPKAAVAVVNDFHSFRHHLRAIRFVIANPGDAANAPKQDKNEDNCFKTGLTCWSFNAQYYRLLLYIPAQGDVAAARVFMLDKDEAGAFQGARLLDYNGGLAFAVAGVKAATFGGNSGDTWWHLWRLDNSGKTQYDGNLLPFPGGVEAILNDSATGILGADFGGVEQTPFSECHACPHIAREFTASWNITDGRYKITMTRIRPSAYAALVQFMRDDERSTQYLDTTANIEHLRNLRANIKRLSTPDNPLCSIVGDESATSKRSDVTELRLTCENISVNIAIKVVRRNDDWYLSDDYVVSS